MTLPAPADVLSTTAGDLPLAAVELQVAERAWSILHSDAVLSAADEQAFLRGETMAKRPYGVVLWPAAIALAHEVASRPLASLRVLELNAGTKLPGIVAASLGARVVQTDRQALVLHVCERNGARNGVTTIAHRIADWTAWDDPTPYDLVIGSDILYASALHPHLRHIFETNLAPGGTVLLADPFRHPSLGLLEAMEADGWRVTMDKWTVGITPPPRVVGVYALTRG
jgi:predicted nicotinamide N-methyase